MGGSRHAELMERLRRLVDECAQSAGTELVDLHLGGGRRRLLRIDIDRAGPAGVGLEECQRVSNAVGQALETDDVIPGSFVLEVSSPGIDRPIRSDDDIRRNTGRRIIAETLEAIDGSRSFEGLLLGCDDGLLRLDTGGSEEVLIPVSNLSSARQSIEFRPARQASGSKRASDPRAIVSGGSDQESVER